MRCYDAFVALPAPLHRYAYSEYLALEEMSPVRWKSTPRGLSYVHFRSARADHGVKRDDLPRRRSHRRQDLACR